MNKMLILLLTTTCMWAQLAVNQTSGPPLDSFVTLTDPGGAGGIPLYIGQAAAYIGPTQACLNLGSTCVKRTDSTLTSIADSSNTATLTTATAHGWWVGQRLTVSGCTVDTDLCASYVVLTVPSTTTATVTTANVTDATYTEATLQVSTTHPRTIDSIWTIQAFKYDASNYLISTYFLSTGTPGATRWRGALSWANRATY